MEDEVCNMDFIKLLHFSPTDVYMLTLLARTKNNDLTKKDRVLARDVIHNLEELSHSLVKMKAIALASGFKTYLYICVNSRSTWKTYKQFKTQLAIYDGEAMEPDKENGKPKARQYIRPISRLDKEWYSALMSPDCKSSKYFVIDIDTKDEATLQLVRDKVTNYKMRVRKKDYCAEILLEQSTRNGYHFVTTAFEPSILAGIPDVGVQLDTLLFLAAFGFDDGYIKTGMFSKQEDEVLHALHEGTMGMKEAREILGVNHDELDVLMSNYYWMPSPESWAHIHAIAEETSKHIQEECDAKNIMRDRLIRVGIPKNEKECSQIKCARCTIFLNLINGDDYFDCPNGDKARAHIRHLYDRCCSDNWLPEHDDDKKWY